MSKVSKLKCDQCNREVPELHIPPDWITISRVYIGGVKVSEDNMYDCLDFCNRKCLDDYLDAIQENDA
jgi:hypothetical protein